MDFYRCIELDESATLFEDACMVCGMKTNDPNFYELHVDLMEVADFYRKGGL